MEINLFLPAQGCSRSSEEDLISVDRLMFTINQNQSPKNKKTNQSEAKMSEWPPVGFLGQTLIWKENSEIIAVKASTCCLLKPRESTKGEVMSVLRSSIMSVSGN